MADCRETIQLLYSYLDEMLDDGLRQDIDTHLVSCPDCQGRMEFEFVVKARIRAKAADEPLSADLERRLLECFDIDLSNEPADDTGGSGQ
jgi:hypothetical protein